MVDELPFPFSTLEQQHSYFSLNSTVVYSKVIISTNGGTVRTLSSTSTVLLLLLLLLHIVPHADFGWSTLDARRMKCTTPFLYSTTVQ